MKCTNATKFHRKSGVAKWRDLLFPKRSSDADEITALSFVFPSEAEGSAFPIRRIRTKWKRCSPLLSSREPVTFSIFSCFLHT
jgi:hypothetical protein